MPIQQQGAEMMKYGTESRSPEAHNMPVTIIHLAAMDYFYVSLNT